MKFTTSNYNPLEDIYTLFDTSEPCGLTVRIWTAFKDLLDLGGVHCETDLEVLRCLEVLHELGFLELEPQEDPDDSSNIFYKVKSK